MVCCQVLAEVDIKSPRLPVISNVDAKPHYDPNEIREILAKQVVSPVQWETIITAMVKAPEFEKSYELGPGTVCRGIVKRCVILLYVCLFCFRLNTHCTLFLSTTTGSGRSSRLSTCKLN
jgi:malonyl CoA-acyl carrier protein transacylase